MVDYDGFGAMRDLEEQVTDLEAEVAQLKAELRQYEPSDGMMIVLLGLNEAIREAAWLLHASGSVKRDTPEHIDAIEAWRRLPVVTRAVKSALAPTPEKPDHG
jgi:hypothetical protein